MYYEICVTRKEGKGYRHFFATAERSLTTEEQAREVLKVMKERFPPPLYSMRLSVHSCTGQTVEDWN